MRHGERNKTTIWLKKKGFVFSEKDKVKKKRRRIAKEMFSAVSCSFGGRSVQIQRLEEGDFWVPTCVESLMG